MFGNSQAQVTSVPSDWTALTFKVIVVTVVMLGGDGGVICSGLGGGGGCLFAMIAGGSGAKGDGWGEGAEEMGDWMGGRAGART